MGGAICGLCSATMEVSRYRVPWMRQTDCDHILEGCVRWAGRGDVHTGLLRSRKARCFARRLVRQPRIHDPHPAKSSPLRVAITSSYARAVAVIMGVRNGNRRRRPWNRQDPCSETCGEKSGGRRSGALPRGGIHFDAMVRAEQTQRQIHDVLFLRLTRDCPAQQLPNLLLKRATMRGGMFLTVSSVSRAVQGHVNIANQQAGHGGLPQLAGISGG